jgi:hypothetical protein
MTWKKDGGGILVKKKGKEHLLFLQQKVCIPISVLGCLVYDVKNNNKKIKKMKTQT